jgi:hypothetical protein
MQESDPLRIFIERKRDAFLSSITLLAQLNDSGKTRQRARNTDPFGFCTDADTACLNTFVGVKKGENCTVQIHAVRIIKNDLGIVSICLRASIVSNDDAARIEERPFVKLSGALTFFVGNSACRGIFLMQ